jgi:hypothetical protein
VVIPLAKSMVIDSNVNEMRFYGNRGDGTIERLAAIGETAYSPTATVIGLFGSAASSQQVTVMALSSSGTPLYAERSSTDTVDGRAAIQAVSRTKGISVLSYGEGSSALANPAISATQIGAGVALQLEHTVQDYPHARLIPFLNNPPLANMLDGHLFMKTGGTLCTYDGVAVRVHLATGDVLKGDLGTAGAPGLTFNGDADTGLYRKASNVLGFSTAGTESGNVDAAGNWEFTGGVTAKNGSASSPSYSFSSDSDTGMYSNAADTLRFSTGGTLAGSVDSAGVWTLTGGAITPTIGPTAGRQHTLPNVASDTIAVLGVAQSFGGRITFNGGVAYSTTWANATTGSTITLTASERVYYNIATATKASLNFNLPGGAVDGQAHTIATDGAITTFSVRDSGGQLINVRNSPGTLPAGGSYTYTYRASTGMWYARSG